MILHIYNPLLYLQWSLDSGEGWRMESLKVSDIVQLLLCWSAITILATAVVVSCVAFIPTRSRFVYFIYSLCDSTSLEQQLYLIIIATSTTSMTFIALVFPFGPIRWCPISALKSDPFLWSPLVIILKRNRDEIGMDKEVRKLLDNVSMNVTDSHKLFK